MNNDIKKVGYTIAMISLIIKGIDLIFFFGSIIEWWKTGIIFYFCLWFTHLATIKSSRSGNNVSVPLSIIMIFVSVLFLLGDVFAFLGFAISLNSTSLMTVGITPLCNLLHIVANISILIEGAVKKPVKRYDPSDEYVSYEEIPFHESDETNSGLQNMNQQFSDSNGSATRAYGTTDADTKYREEYGSDAFGG